MSTMPSELPTDLAACHELIRELFQTLPQQTHLNEKLQHQLEQLLRRVYGRRSEKLDPDRLWLFAREIMAKKHQWHPRSRGRSGACTGRFGTLLGRTAGTGEERDQLRPSGTDAGSTATARQTAGVAAEGVPTAVGGLHHRQAFLHHSGQPSGSVLPIRPAAR